MNVIRHKNILYIRDISQLGGVETWAYEIAKKYHNLDLAVVVKTIDPAQLKRLIKYVPVYRHRTERIECDVAVINYDTSIIPFIDAKVGIYQTIHGDYENPAYKWKSPTSPKIKEYICITKYLMDSVHRITENTNLRLSYNPLTPDKADKPLVLLSATRLSPVKGRDRMEKLAKALDKAKVSYVWIVLTNDIIPLRSPNVIFAKPNLDIARWYELADYVVQLSDTEACSYTIAEALFRNKPVIVTPLPYLEEIGVKDGKNAYIMEFDCSNIKDIVKNITNVPKFKFDKWDDDYGNIFVKSKSTYTQDDEVEFLVKKKYHDVEIGEIFYPGKIINVSRRRGVLLAATGVGEIKEEHD